MPAPEATKTHVDTLDNHRADNYNVHANFVYSAKYTSAVLELLNAQPGEKILDLGCGTGELTEVIKKAVGADGVVVGADSSEDMIINARANNITNDITYLPPIDAMDYTTFDPSLKGTFDAVFSSATFHWCKRNPGGVLETVKWLLKPGGRMAFEMGGFGNTVGVRSAIHQVLRKKGIDPVPLDPWYFPTVGQYSALLEEHGFASRSIALYPRPSPLPTDLAGWLRTFACNVFFAQFNPQQVDDLVAEITEICRPDNFWSVASPGIGLKPTDGQAVAAGQSGWEIMYVRLRGEVYVK